MRCEARRYSRTPSAWWTIARRVALARGAALVTGAGLAACGGSADHALARATGRPHGAAAGPDQGPLRTGEEVERRGELQLTRGDALRGNGGSRVRNGQPQQVGRNPEVDRTRRRG